MVGERRSNSLRQRSQTRQREKQVSQWKFKPRGTRGQVRSKAQAKSEAHERASQDNVSRRRKQEATVVSEDVWRLAKSKE